MEFIASNTVTATGLTSVTFSSIPQTYDDLKLVLSGRTLPSVTQNLLRLRFNGDNGSNYVHLYLRSDSSTVSTATNTVTGLWVGAMNGGSTLETGFSNFNVDIPNYSGSSLKTTISEGVTGASTSPWHYIMTGFWNNTNNITSIEIFNLNFPELAIGSSFYLYGIKKGSDGITTVS
jgi:hypothetical protein